MATFSSAVSMSTAATDPEYIPKDTTSNSNTDGTNQFNRAAAAFGNVPELLFNSKSDREKAQLSIVSEYARSKALTPVDGLAKGLTAFGDSLVKGITGVVTEPIRGAAEKGTEGFFSGIGKGLLGVVFKPIGGVLEFGGKVGEGFVNTPETLASLVRPSDTTLFEVPLLDSFEHAKTNGRKHVFLRTLEILNDSTAKTTAGLFVYGAPAKTIQDIAIACDQGLDVELNPLDPIVAVGVLLHFLDKLPEPLVPPQFHAPLASLITGHKNLNISHPVVKRVHILLSKMPSVNKSVLAELCLSLRCYFKASNAGDIALDHISLSIGRRILKTRVTPTSKPSSSGDDDDGDGKDNSHAFASPEHKAFVLQATKLLIKFYSPGHLTYMLSKPVYTLEL